MEASLDRIRAWEESTGGFFNIKNQGSTESSSNAGVPF